VIPVLLPQLVKFNAVRQYMFRTLSQIKLNYRGKGLDHGQAGSVHGGERLPWLRADGIDNYEALKRMSWQVHVYGEARDTLKRWCAERGIPLHVYPWPDHASAVGLKQDALYLIRPDTYVALAEAGQNTSVVERFLEQVQVTLGAGGRPS
jgi:hypothetical protein